MSTSQILFEDRQSEPENILVESIPVQEERKLSPNSELHYISSISWEDMRGLFWNPMAD